MMNGCGASSSWCWCWAGRRCWWRRWSSAGRRRSTGSTAAAATVPSSPTVRTLLGPSTLDSPGGLALNTAGDLFVADTGHCRVLVLPARSGVVDGLTVRAGHVSRPGRRLVHRRPLDGSPDRRGGRLERGRLRRRGHGPAGAGDTAGRAVATAAGHRGTPAQLVTVAGTGTAGFNGDGLAGPASELDQPTGVAVDAPATSSSPTPPTAGCGSWPPTRAPCWAGP